MYGTAARLGKAGEGAQHQGLGRQLVERACAIAAAEGYRAANVISAVGMQAPRRAGTPRARVLREARF